MTTTAKTGQELADELDAAFCSQTRPISFFDVSAQFRKLHEKEFSSLEKMKWKTAKPADFKNIYECSTFISAEAYKYLIPHVFRFCVTWTDEAHQLDFIGIFCTKPIFNDEVKEFDGYTKQQKKLVWESLTFLDDTLGFDFIDSEEGWEKLSGFSWVSH